MCLCVCLCSRAIYPGHWSTPRGRTSRVQKKGHTGVFFVFRFLNPPTFCGSCFNFKWRERVQPSLPLFDVGVECCLLIASESLSTPPYSLFREKQIRFDRCCRNLPPEISKCWGKCIVEDHRLVMRFGPMCPFRGPKTEKNKKNKTGNAFHWPTRSFSLVFLSVPRN